MQKEAFILKILLLQIDNQSTANPLFYWMDNKKEGVRKNYDSQESFTKKSYLSATTTAAGLTDLSHDMKKGAA